MRNKLGIDLDGVVFDFERGILEYARRAGFISRLPESPQTNYSFTGSGAPFQNETHYDATHESFTASFGYYDLPIIPGAIEGIAGLLQHGVDLVFVTARGSDIGSEYVNRLKDDTKRALERRALGEIPLIFSSNKHDWVEVLVDDAPHNIEEMRANNLSGIVFDQAYNRHVPGHRIFSLEQLLSDEWLPLIK